MSEDSIKTTWETTPEFVKFIYWSFRPPRPEKLSNPDQIPDSYSEYKERFSVGLGPASAAWIDKLKVQYEQETQRCDKIESKATSILTQNSLITSVVSILFAALLTSDAIRVVPAKVIILILSLVMLLFFVCAVLSALNVIAAHYPYPIVTSPDTIEEMRKPKDVADGESIADWKFSIDHTSFLNDMKLTWLRAGHDFYRLGMEFLLLVIVLLSLVFAYQIVFVS